MQGAEGAYARTIGSARLTGQQGLRFWFKPANTRISSNPRSATLRGDNSVKSTSPQMKTESNYVIKPLSSLGYSEHPLSRARGSSTVLPSSVKRFKM